MELDMNNPNLPDSCTEQMVEEAYGKEVDTMELFSLLDAVNDDELSDGAWFAVLMDTVEAWNSDNDENLDLHDTVLEWIQKRGV